MSLPSVGSDLGPAPAAAGTAEEGSPSSDSSQQGMYTVKVNGADQQVTLDELQAGYSRQQDYTQKTQILANQQRELAKTQALQSALERNPAEALRTIAAHYNLVAPSGGPVPQVQLDEDGEPVQVDPAVAELRGEIETLQSQLHTMATSTQADRLRGELDKLETAYGSEVDRNEILLHMKANGIPTAELAYRDLHFADAQAALSAQNDRAAAEAKILAEKQGQQGLVHQGGSVAEATTEAAETDFSGMSLADALEVALGESMQEHGVTSLADPALQWD